MSISRRGFLQATGASAVISCGVNATPQFLLRAAADESGREDGRILVVIQLSGGNDGLNTVVPYANDVYRTQRPKLAFTKERVHKINDQLGLHPSMTGFAELLQDQKLAIVQGVGYPNPNRSHFESMDIWHTCYRKDVLREDGWLGRFLDQQQAFAGGDVPALHLGNEKQPFALAANRTRVSSVRSLDSFRLLVGNDKDVRATIEEVTRADRKASSELLDFVQTSAAAALDASRRVEKAERNYQALATYPQTKLGEKLKKIAQLIHAGLKTRIYYVTHDGFDTHSNQANAHAALLEQLSGAVAAFSTDLNKHGTGDRVLTMAFSEFGRRVKENASEGTDHGTAAPMFLIGPAVHSGLVGKHPDLKDLQQGDLKYHTDFRQVYSCVLQRWLSCDSEAILGGTFSPVDALRKNA